MAQNKKLNLKARMLEGKQRAQALPAAQEPVAAPAPVAEPVVAPAPVVEAVETPAPAKAAQPQVLTETKRAMTLARTDDRNYMKGETFTVQNDVLALLDATVGGDFIADRIEWLVKLGIAADIAYREKTGDMLARSNSEGFHGSVHSDLMAIFEDADAVAYAEAHFAWAKDTAASKAQ
jgi:hypothetical protein